MAGMEKNSYIEGLVSVITPAFNSAKFIEDCIHSVQAQSYNQWEMLVVIDAGTTDNTAEIVEKISKEDPRVRLIVIKNKRGISLSRNTGLENARGRYIAFLDSDDLWLPHKLELQLKFMVETHTYYCCGGYRRISEDGTLIGKYIGVPDQIDYELTLRNNTIGCLTIMLDRKALDIGRFVERHQEDYVFNLEILKRGYICRGLNQDLARYRFVHNARSRAYKVLIPSRWSIYRQREKFSRLKSTWLILNYIFFALQKRIHF